MNLRPRLALTAMAVGVPLLVGLAWIRLSLEHSQAVAELKELALE